MFFVEGIAAISEYVRFRHSRMVAIVCDEKIKSQLIKLNSKLDVDWLSIEACAEKYGEIRTSSSVMALVRIVPIGESDLFDKIAHREKDLIVALDHITDPRNLGAIARSCGFFGVKEIIVAKDRQVLLTGASVATAQGGFALVDLCIVTNLNRYLEQMKEKGYWVVGADMNGEEIQAVKGFYEKTILVLGNEGDGISDQVLKKCDRVVSIKGNGIGLESLNVSVAAGILLNDFKI